MCTNVSSSLDYEDIYLLMKRFGEVKRIRLILARDNCIKFDCYAVFDNSKSAAQATDVLNEHNVNGCTLKTK